MHSGPFGYYYDDPKWNDLFYPILGSIYVPHAYTGGPPWNWRQASNVRRVRWSHISLSDRHPVAEMAAHATAFQQMTV